MAKHRFAFVGVECCTRTFGTSLQTPTNAREDFTGIFVKSPFVRVLAGHGWSTVTLSVAIAGLLSQNAAHALISRRRLSSKSPR